MEGSKREDLSVFLAQSRAMATRYAKRGPYVLNPYPDAVESVLLGLARNRLQYGHFYCPCKRVSNEPTKDRLNICPCSTHHEEIAQGGSCECGLFMSPEFAARQIR